MSYEYYPKKTWNSEVSTALRVAVFLAAMGLLAWLCDSPAVHLTALRLLPVLPVVWTAYFLIRAVQDW